MTDDYAALLERARDGLPVDTGKSERFEMPQFETFPEGQKTVVKNFVAVCNILERKPEHVSKFITSFTGGKSNLEGKILIISAPKTQKFLNEKLALYIKKFVTCEGCGKPDTAFTIADGVVTLKCKACGKDYSPK